MLVTKKSRLKKIFKFRSKNVKSKFHRLIINKTINNIYINLISPYPDKKIIFSISTLNKNIKNILNLNKINSCSIKASLILGEYAYNFIKNNKTISNIFLDISGFKYHGKIKAFCEFIKKKCFNNLKVF